MTRFANLPRGLALAWLVGIVALIALGLGSPARPLPKTKPRANDLTFYQAVIHRVREGEDYDAATVDQLRAKRQPVRPFLVVRPPALAVLTSWLPNDEIADRAVLILALGVIWAWTLRLRPLSPRPAWIAACGLVIFNGVGMMMAGGGIGLLHEAWAGLLIALSLVLRTEKRFAAAVLLGLAAALIRELAMPYLAVMAIVALMERRRGEALAFALALAFSLAALAWHAHAVMALTTSHDPASSGWIKFGGWRFVMATARLNLISLLAGAWAAAVIVPLALAGAAGWRDRTGLRLFLLLAGYALGFTVIGQPQNAYWGFMIAPLLAVGLCLSPFAVMDLVRRSAGVRHRLA